MNNFFVEPTWKEIFYQQFPHLKKDRTFSSDDLIRFYENNLDMVERGIVEDYFCALCPEDLPPPVPPEVPFLPPPLPPPSILLPPIIITLPPKIIYEQLPPPPLPIFLLPVFPFIIPSLLPEDILNLLKEYLGVPEAQAAISYLEEDLRYWKEKYYLDYGRHVTKGVRPERLPTYLWGEVPQIETEVPQIETEVPQIETEYEFEPEDTTEDIWDEWFGTDDDIDGDDEPVSQPSDTSESDAQTMEIINFYALLEQMEWEADRIDMDLEWRGWVRLEGTVWYMFDIEGIRYEYTLWELQSILKILREIPTPDEILI